MFLASLASVTCLFRANVREIISAPGGREAMERALAANAEIAAREGHPPSASGLDFARTRLTDPTGPWSASMLRDLESGGRVEADHIVGWMLDRGPAARCGRHAALARVHPSQGFRSAPRCQPSTRPLAKLATETCRWRILRVAPNYENRR